MGVSITQDELTQFKNHGVTPEQLKTTVEAYRSQGLDDTAIRAKVDQKLKSWATPTPQKVVKPVVKNQPVQKPIIDNNPTEYQKILQDNTLTKEQKAQKIQAFGEAERKQIETEKNKNMARIGLGATMQGLSGLPAFKTPFVGSAAAGALFDAGGAIMEGENIANIAKRAARGAAAGATVEGAIKAIPVVGKPLAQSKVGRTVIDKSNEALKPLAENKIVQKVGEELIKERNLPVVAKKTVVRPQVQPASQVADKVAEVVEEIPRNNVTNKINNVVNNTKERASIDTIAKAYGDDVASQITDTTYKTRGKEVVKAEFEALNPEQQAQLINSAEDTSDVATYAKAQYLKSEINNGNIPVSTLNKWVSLGTKKAQELQSQQFLAPDTIEGAVVQMQNAIYKSQPKQTQKLLNDASKLANKIKELSPKQKAAQIDKMLANYAIKPIQRKNFVEKILKLNELDGLNEENLTKLINKEFKIPEIDQNDINNLTELVGKINSATTPREKDIATQLMAKTINKKLPRNWSDIDQTYRTINMLLSPKSRAKDALGTALYQGERFLDEAFAKIPALLSKARGFNTRDFGFENKQWREGFKRGLREVAEDVKMGINTGRSGEGARFDLTKLPQFEGVPILEQTEKLLNYSIKGVDRPFYEAAYEASLANQLKAQGLTEPTEEIIEQAIKEAQQAVFQRNGILAEQGLKGRDFLNFKNTPLEKLKLGQRNIPFLQTISNLTQEGLNATPLTLPSNLYKYANAKSIGELRDAELALGKNLKGAVLYTPIAKAILDDKIKSNIGELNSLEASENDITGLPAQGIALGDKAISLANMPQAVIPIAVYKNLLGAENVGQGLLKGSLQAASALADLPALKGLGDIVKGTGDVIKAGEKVAYGDTDAVENAAKRLAKQYISNQVSQYIPIGGFLGNIRNVVDPYKRELTNDNILDYTNNRIMNRLPALSDNLPIKYNAIGQPSMVTNIENPIARAVGELIDPFNVRNYNEKPVSVRELERLTDYARQNDLQGKNTIKYPKVDKKINDEALTNEQISEYQRILGGMNFNALEQIMENNYYKNLPIEQKIEMVKEQFKNNNDLAKNMLFNIPLKNTKIPDIKQKQKEYQNKKYSYQRKKHLIDPSYLYYQLVGQE